MLRWIVRTLLMLIWYRWFWFHFSLLCCRMYSQLLCNIFTWESSPVERNMPKFRRKRTETYCSKTGQRAFISQRTSSYRFLVLFLSSILFTTQWYHNICLQIQKLGSLGLMGILVSKEYGGSDMNSLALSVAVEELARLVDLRIMPGKFEHYSCFLTYLQLGLKL